MSGVSSIGPDSILTTGFDSDRHGFNAKDAAFLSSQVSGGQREVGVLAINQQADFRALVAQMQTSQTSTNERIAGLQLYMAQCCGEMKAATAEGTCKILAQLANDKVAALSAEVARLQALLGAAAPAPAPALR